MSEKITLFYSAVDGDWTEEFTSLSDAANHLNYQLGRFDYGGGYAVSFDGIAKCYAVEIGNFVADEYLRDLVALARQQNKTN